MFDWDGSPVVILKIKILPHLDVPPRAALNCMRPPFCKNSSAIASVLLVHLLPATSLPFDPPSPSPSSPSAAFVPTRSVRSSSSSSTTSTMSTDEQSEQPPQGLNGMDLVIDGWFHERGVLWPGQAMSLEVKEVLDHHRSDFQDVLVFQSANHGKVLVLDGVIQVTERDEFAYQEMIAHLPLFAHPNPKKVLVIGGGDGGVLREIAKHPGVEEIVICEIDGDVIDVSKKYLKQLAVGFDDPRVKVRVMDGAKFMSDNPGTFDVIITDSSDPVGPANVLFETPFYKGMYAALAEGGIVCTQGECMWLHCDIIRPLMNSIGQFYTSVGYAYTTIPTYPSGQIGFILATKGRGPCDKAARKPSEEMQDNLQYYTAEIHEAAFVLPAFARRAILGDK